MEGRIIKRTQVVGMIVLLYYLIKERLRIISLGFKTLITG